MIEQQIDSDNPKVANIGPARSVPTLRKLAVSAIISIA